jgi:hypothetical protein
MSDVEARVEDNMQPLPKMFLCTDFDDNAEMAQAAGGELREIVDRISSIMDDSLRILRALDLTESGSVRARTARNYLRSAVAVGETLLAKMDRAAGSFLFHRDADLFHPLTAQTEASHVDDVPTIGDWLPSCIQRNQHVLATFGGDAAILFARCGEIVVAHPRDDPRVPWTTWPRCPQCVSPA